MNIHFERVMVEMNLIKRIQNSIQVKIFKNGINNCFGYQITQV